VETPLHPQKIGVWLVVSRRRTIGPIFFNQTVTAARYRNDLLEPFLNELHDDEFTRDNATAHSTRQTSAYLKEFF
jgi:hypothetical protein